MPRQFSDDREEFIDALRLSDQDHQAIVNELDRGATSPGSEKRLARRLPYKSVKGLVLQVTHPGGNTVRFLVKPRNISQSGLSVMHGGFVHPSTACSVPLRDLCGKTTRIDGKIVSCRLIRGRVHELGVKFHKAIAVHQYVLDADVDSDPSAAGPITLPTLRGRVLVADEWPDDRQLVAYDLQKLGLEPTPADGGADALRRLKQASFDVILAGEWLGDMAAPDFAGAARQLGCGVPIVGVFSSPDDALHARAAAAGIGAVVHKPYKTERLAQVLMQHLRMSSADDDAAPIGHDLSEKWGEVGMRPMILAFLQGLDIRLSDLDAQLRQTAGGAGDPAQTCLRLKGAAASYGFPRISAAAGDLASLLATRADIGALKSAMDELATLASTALGAAEREANRA